MGMIEGTPEITTKEKDLTFLIGYYALMIDSVKLTPDWRASYEERQQQLQEELDAFRNNS